VDHLNRLVFSSECRAERGVTIRQLLQNSVEAGRLDLGPNAQREEHRVRDRPRVDLVPQP
jgi:hypothetical protein